MDIPEALAIYEKVEKRRDAFEKACFRYFVNQQATEFDSSYSAANAIFHQAKRYSEHLTDDEYKASNLVFWYQRQLEKQGAKPDENPQPG